MRVYADYAASAPMRTCAKEAMMEAMEVWGNPSSVHKHGLTAHFLLEKARKEIASVINCRPDEIIFTSGGTEANNLALHRGWSRDTITSAFEHPSVLSPLTYEVGSNNQNLVSPDIQGIIHPEDVGKKTDFSIRMVTIMTANNEIGAIQPIQEITQEAKRRGAKFVHTDAVQAVGHIPIDVQELGVDLLSMSAHKFGGPKGVGVLYCRKGIEIFPLIHGGGQERGRRSGTENVPAIIGMAAALLEAQQKMAEETQTLNFLRGHLIAAITEIPGFHIHGSLEETLPGIVNCRFDGVEGESLVLLLDHAGIAISAGSACHSESLDPSRSITALGVQKEEAYGAVRISLGYGNTLEEVEYLGEQLKLCVEAARRGGHFGAENKH